MNVLPDLWLDPLLVLSPALRNAWQAVGLANVEFHPARVRSGTGDESEQEREYFAANVVGRVLEGKTAMLGGRDVLSLPPWPGTGARGALMFRQVGRLEAVFVHDRLRRAALAAEVDAPVFLGAGME